MNARPILLVFPLIIVMNCEGPSVLDEQLVKVHFRYGFMNELNTFEKYYQKDLVMDGVAVTEFWFTTEDQEEILAEAERYGFFELPDTIRIRPTGDSVAIRILPDPGHQFLRIYYEEQDHTVHWTYPLLDDTVHVPRLRGITDFLIQLIESNPAWQALPPVHGGYI